MLFSKLRVFIQHGRQTIRHMDSATMPPSFRGVPQLTTGDLTTDQRVDLAAQCPSGALVAEPFSIDMGRCLFCGHCARVVPENIRFTNNYHMASSLREGLIVVADTPYRQVVEPSSRSVVFRSSLHLRQVCAGGDGACEIELDAAGNVNFDMRRYGIEFVASPRHADGVVLTGAITRKMAQPLLDTYNAVAEPKLLIVVGADAISGGLFSGSAQIDRSFFDTHTPDLYIPGHPSHPLVIIDGLRKLTGQKKIK